VTDYRGHRQTVLPVREINLKACTPVILKQFILLGPGIDPADNRFRSARTVPLSQRDKCSWVKERVTYASGDCGCGRSTQELWATPCYRCTSCCSACLHKLCPRWDRPNDRI